MVTTTQTFKFRIKNKHAKAMLAMARDVNTVWNFCNETPFRSLKRYCNRPKVWLSGYDLKGLPMVSASAMVSPSDRPRSRQFAKNLRRGSGSSNGNDSTGV
ncbi:MAG: hypothetical protein VB131_02855 [Burkholderia gladioli]